MIRLFRFFHIAWSLYKSGGAWAEDCEWGVQDAVSLRLFLSGEVGQRFKARMRNASNRMNATAVLSSDPAAEGRKAAGYMLAIEDISALSVPQIGETYEEDDFGADVPLESQAP